MPHRIPNRAVKHISGLKVLKTLGGTSIPRRIHARQRRVTYQLLIAIMVVRQTHSVAEFLFCATIVNEFWACLCITILRPKNRFDGLQSSAVSNYALSKGHWKSCQILFRGPIINERLSRLLRWSKIIYRPVHRNDPPIHLLFTE